MHDRCWRTALAATVIVCFALSSCGDRSRLQQTDAAPAAKHPPIDLQIEGRFIRVVCLAEHLDSTWVLSFVDVEYELNLKTVVRQVRKHRGFDRMGQWFKEMKEGDTLRIPLLALGATEKDIPQELQFLQNSDTLFNWEVKNSVARYTGYSVFQH